MGYKIASFNMRNFSENASGRFDALAKIFKRENCDIIALQEVLVLKYGGVEGLKMSLRRFFPESQYDIRISEISYDTDRRGEQFAYIWRKDKIRLVETIVYRKDYGSAYIRTYEPRLLNADRNAFNEFSVDITKFARPPFFARFEPVHGGYFEFRLIDVHLYFGDETLTEIRKRQAEQEVLSRELFPSVSLNRKYGNNKQAITIVMGDYNLNLLTPENKNNKTINQMASAEQEYPVDGQLVRTIQEHQTSLKKPDNSRTGIQNGYSQNYDHFTVDAQDMQQKGIWYRSRRIDAVEKYYNGDFNQYQSEISDHVPIIIYISFFEEDMDNG